MYFNNFWKTVMNYDVRIENLGAIREANITIAPLTIVAGENGTGKSFVTKMLYSVLNTIILDIFSNEVTRLSSKINGAIDNANEIFENLSLNGNQTHDVNELKKDLETFFTVFNKINPHTLMHLNTFSDYDVKESINVFKTKTLLKKKENVNDDEHHNIESAFASFLLENLSENLNKVLKLVENPKNYFIQTFIDNLSNEIKNNFQISKISSLVKYGESKAVFDIKGLLKIEIYENDSLNLFFEEDKLFSYNEINRAIFFESPVYWKILPIINNKNQNILQYFSKSINNKRLSGVPKHFLDLKDLIFADFLNDTPPEFISDSARSLENRLKGKFKIANEDLNFETQDGQIIPKSLISFGMTNLGILQAVLGKNIINKGSFVFIDEPESNLHPEWQAILASVLVDLAKNGVYVIITTHSSDILKAFDVITQEKKIDKDLLTYYFNPNGTLLELHNKKYTAIDQARKELLKTYEKLLVRGYQL